MMFTFLSFFITVCLVALTVLGARCQTTREMKKYLWINVVIFLVSFIGGALTTYLAHETIFRGVQSAEWQGWAWDAFLLFVKTTLPVFGCALALILVTTIITSFVSKKANVFSSVVRQSASVALSVILLFITPFYSAMAETAEASVHVFVLVFGICEALFMRLSFVVEMMLRIKRNEKE